MTEAEIKNLYPYLYETHMHTYEGSACAKSLGADMAKAYKDYGYSGVIVTDHNWGGNTRVDRDAPWEEMVSKFFEGYENAKAMGEKIGLDVFCGYEAGFDGTEFLITGITPKWVADHPQLRHISIEDQYKLVSAAGGLVIQAHPYREEFYIPEIRVFPDWVDGVEGVNATHSNSKSVSHNDPEFDTKAIAYANEHNLPMTAGSDMHNTNLFGGGVAFKTKIRDIEDYISRIKNHEDYVLTNGEHWYTATGELLV